jgi:multimeric flavodoxin WrbA
MKVVLVNGSPHKQGSTHRALLEMCHIFNSEGIDTEIFWTGNAPISGCRSCWACQKTGKCIISDVVNDFHQIAGNADGFVFASPVHYAAISGAMTSFMDRVFTTELCGHDGEHFRLKPVCGVASARRAGTTSALDQLNRYFTESQMLIVSSSYWNMVFGQNAEEVEQDKEGLRTMRILAKNMGYVMKCKEAAKNTGIPLPLGEAEISTNFIR